MTKLSYHERKARHRVCSRCGTDVVYSEKIVGYWTDTGKPKLRMQWKCPHTDWKDVFRNAYKRHTNIVDDESAMPLDVCGL